MEEKSRKCPREKEEDVATSVTMEKNNDKDPAAPVSGTVTAAALWHSRKRGNGLFPAQLWSEEAE